jgi:hypothetical protein
MKALLTLAAGIAAVATAGLHGNSPGIDAAAIREALNLGRTGNPAPYQLFINTTPTGFVYTPFLRVAIASKAAHDAGRELAASELPSAIWLNTPRCARFSGAGRIPSEELASWR